MKPLRFLRGKDLLEFNRDSSGLTVKIVREPTPTPSGLVATLMLSPDQLDGLRDWLKEGDDEQGTKVQNTKHPNYPPGHRQEIWVGGNNNPQRSSPSGSRYNDGSRRTTKQAKPVIRYPGRRRDNEDEYYQL